MNILQFFSTKNKYTFFTFFYFLLAFFLFQEREAGISKVIDVSYLGGIGVLHGYVGGTPCHGETFEKQKNETTHPGFLKPQKKQKKEENEDRESISIGHLWTARRSLASYQAYYC